MKRVVIFASGLLNASITDLIAFDLRKKPNQRPKDETKYNGAPIRKIKRGKKKRR